MKAAQVSKSTPSSSMSSKSKKSKDREKRKSQTESSNHNSDKGSPSKEANSRQYAGISGESISAYAEQTAYEHLKEDVSNTLSEDINYKLRYVIHDALLKARLSGRNKISSKDIEETFENLSIDKVYGAQSNPNWIPLDQNYLYLDDSPINLIEISEEDSAYVQPASVTLQKRFYPEEVSKVLKQYFQVTCTSIVSRDDGLRNMALQDISTNAKVGPIVEWYYRFGYFLLCKDITYDSLTLHALDLIETLENSPLGSMNVSEKQLKLLVRLILQRLVMSKMTEEVLKPMCSVLAILCLRPPLREFVIQKINQKMHTVCHQVPLQLLTMINFLGYDAVVEIFLPNMEVFLNKIEQDRESWSMLTYPILGIYGIICRADLNNLSIQNAYHEVFGNDILIFWKAQSSEKALEKDELNFVQMKTQLIKTRRKVDHIPKKRLVKRDIEEVFEVPAHDCKLKEKLDAFRLKTEFGKKETHITVGKTSLLLSVLRQNSNMSKCCDHTLLGYNF